MTGVQTCALPIYLKELGTRTFKLNYPGEVNKILIAPVLVSSSGENYTGAVLDTYLITSKRPILNGLSCSTDSDCPRLSRGSPYCFQKDLFENQTRYICFSGLCTKYKSSELVQSCEGYGCVGDSCQTPVIQCLVDSDCGASDWITSPYCDISDGNLWQNWIQYSCSSGECSNQVSPKMKSVCKSGCNNQTNSCNPEPECQTNLDCGENGLIGSPACQGNLSYQYYVTYFCTNNSCSNSVANNLVENCSAEGKICDSGSCYLYLQCLSTADCPYGTVCISHSCIPETITNNGTIDSIWPPELGEYFDSQNLPKNNSLNLIGYYVKFSQSAETKCLKIREFVPHNSTLYSSYIRLNESSTNISTGDKYGIWETSFGCSQL